MNEKLTAVSFGSGADAALCSRIMRKAISMLFADGMAFDCVLYPYADALLLSLDNGMFGTHAIFYRVEGKQLEECVEQVCAEIDFGRVKPVITELECTRKQIVDFLSKDKSKSHAGAVCFGGLPECLGGVVYPWSVRECSKQLCSFAEQAAAINGVKIVGYTGSGPQFYCPRVLRTRISELFERKTGSQAHFSRR